MQPHLERFAQVAQILTHHGLGVLAAATGLDRWPVGQFLGLEPTRSNPQRLRLALEELGPVFVKLGQMLSTRPDLLPPDYLAELSKLQDGAPAVPTDTIRSLIFSELGATPEKLFATFDDTPLASASIGQAHAATLRDGTEVVVKVRRPNIVAQINEDLEILENLASHASHHWAAAADLDLSGIASDFAATLRAELDYLQEGRNAERFAANFADTPDIHIPRIFWDTTTYRVLTIERIRGIKVDDVLALDRAGIDRHALAERAAMSAAKMIFDDGFFHADPHAGNLFVEPSGTIGLIDFGMVGHVNAQLRNQLAKLLLAFTSNNPGQVTTALLDISLSHSITERSALRKDATVFTGMYQGKALGQLEIGPLILQMWAILRNHHLQLPQEMAMLLKMLLMIEGMGARLDPDFSLGETLKPYASRLAMDRFKPSNVRHTLTRWGLSAMDLGVSLPEKLERLAEHMDDGVEVHLRATELEPLVARIERIGNRLVAGVIAAAFIRGLGDLTTADGDRLRRLGKPLAAAGTGALATVGAYLVLTARRRRGGRQ